MDCFLVDGTEITDRHMIANKFNEYFVEIGPKLASNIFNSATSFTEFLKPPSISFIGVNLTSAAEISISNTLRSTYSRGIDDIDLNG
jgi:hypothetical protein